ncbi:MAG: M20/M25/M40 family metallo-hydrolase [Oscillospiraceae bacterium]|nr:M20/M25/M40 family metallo-hydrolase [Oscillospiraceae bacterium]
MNIKQELIKICEIPGPAGFEEKIALHVKALFEKYMDDTWIDVLGNVIGVRKSKKENAKKLLFDAHIDEIGLIVIGVEEGFLKFAPLGGLDARVIPASSVTIMTEPPIYGIISVLPPHILKDEDVEKNIKIEDMFIDIGLSQEEAEKLVKPGTPGVLARSVKEFGENKLCGSSIDDRVGVIAILQALELLKDKELDVDLYVMASVQEEVGVRGATTGAYAIAPDYCIVVDVDHAKTPDAKKHEANTKLDDGAIITRGPNMNTSFTDKILSIAQENDIKHQISVIASGSAYNNVRSIQISREGVITAVIGVPMKYMHTTNEVVSLDDINSIANLLNLVATANLSRM